MRINDILVLFNRFADVTFFHHEGDPSEATVFSFSNNLIKFSSVSRRSIS